MAANVQFYVTNLRSGLVVGELPHLQLTSMTYTMGESTTASAVLSWQDLPSNWVTLTTPYVSAIVMCVDYVPYWGGIILTRTRELGGDGIELSLATPEHFLDQIYVTDQSFSQVSQTEIAASLITTNLEGKHFTYGMRVDTSTTLRDRTYTEDSDKTVLHYLTNLMEVSGGIDFCHRWQWTDDRSGIIPVFWVSDHIGSSMPTTIFDETSITAFTLEETYTTGYGAVRVMATGSSSDEDMRPSSGWVQASQSARPLVEYKYSPGSSITETATLQSYASQTLDNIANGTITAEFTMSLLDAPKVWEDWQPGDVLGWQVNEASGQFPDLASTMITARVVGYSLNFSGAWELTCTVQSQDTVVQDDDSDEDADAD